MKKKILIVGGTGFIGFNLVKKLKKKFQITSISTNKFTKNRIKDVRYLFFDFTKKKNLDILDKYFFDIVINLGGNVDHINKKLTEASQFSAVKNLIDYFKKRKLKIFIQIGSCAEYGMSKSPHNEKNKGNPKLIYGNTKLKATKYVQEVCRKNSMKGIILRLYQIYGPLQSRNRFIPIIINQCLKNKTYFCHKKGVYRDFLYIDDLLNLFIKILRKKNINKYSGQIFNVGYGKPFDLNRVAKKIKILSKSSSLSKEKVKLRSDEPKIIYPNIYRVKKVFDWKPKVKFEVGLKKTVNFYKNSKLF